MGGVVGMEAGMMVDMGAGMEQHMEGVRERLHICLVVQALLVKEFELILLMLEEQVEHQQPVGKLDQTFVEIAHQ